MWDQLTIGYLASLIDGEGTIGSDGKRKQHVKISVASTEFDIVQRAHTMSGIGNIQGPYENKGRRKNGSPRKQRWNWEVTRKSEIARLLCAVAPIMSKRRRIEIVKVADYIYDHIPRLKNCVVCGTGFIPGEGKQKRKMYCSRACGRTVSNARRRQVRKTAKETGSFFHFQLWYNRLNGTHRITPYVFQNSFIPRHLYHSLKGDWNGGKF